MNISFVITAFNEEDSLPILREAIKDFQNIILIDNFSTDNTEYLAKSYGWDHYLFKNRGYAEDPQLVKFYLSLVKTEWIYVCRADEIPSESLVNFLKYGLKENIDAIRIQRVNYLNGKRCTAWGKDFETPIFRKNSFRVYENTFRFGYPGYFPKNVKIRTLQKKRGYYLKHNIDYTSKGFFETINRYSSLWTNNEFKNEINQARSNEESYIKHLLRKLRILIYSYKLTTFFSILILPTLRFLFHYLLKGGFLSGYTGLLASLFMMIEEYMIGIKVLSKKLNWPVS